MTDEWTLPDFDSLFSEDSVVLRLRFTCPRRPETPQLHEDAKLEGPRGVRAEMRVVMQRIVEKVKNELTQLAELKEFESILFCDRYDLKQLEAARMSADVAPAQASPDNPPRE